VARWRSAGIINIKWLCVQEQSVGTRKSPLYLTRRLATAGLKLAAVMMTRIRIKPSLHTGAVCPHTEFVESLFFISPRTGHGSSKLFVMLPGFLCISLASAFLAGGDAPMLLSGPVEAEEGTSFLLRRAGSSEISWRILYSVKKTLHRHRAGFEPQRASSFRSRVKVPKIIGKAVRA
jgi:hypothetical protein